MHVLLWLVRIFMWALVLLSALVLITEIFSTPEQQAATRALFGLAVIVFCISLLGSLLLGRFTGSAKRKRNERLLFERATRQGGTLTVAEAHCALGGTIDQAVKELDRLHSQGVCGKSQTKYGMHVYLFSMND
ncbi:MAG: hypothetical protein ACPGPF_06865 [Pontibacterium sp.]